MWCHGRVIGHFNWTNARISRNESGSWWARDEWSLWRRVSLAILSPEHLQNDMWSKMLGKTQILPEKLIQEWRWIVNHIVMEFCILFWDHISSFNETCLVFVSLLFWNQQMFSISFWQNILIKLQHAIKINQSWRFKSVLITEMTRCLLKWHEVTKQILSPYMKPNHTSCS
jgi:hypothetical protein